jgi:hypothetical protein
LVEGDEGSAQAYTTPRSLTKRQKQSALRLDVWCGSEVLNIEWTDDGAIEVVSYQPGDWEGRLLAATNA